MVALTVVPLIAAAEPLMVATVMSHAVLEAKLAFSEVSSVMVVV